MILAAFTKEVSILKVYSKSIKEILKKYYEFRYWGTLYRNMAKTIINGDQLGEYTPYINKPGIAFSFDDSYRVYEWYKYGKPIFDKNDVKVTFNINGVHPLKGNRLHNQQEIDLLLELQSDGHEIGNHGFKHQKATDFTNRHSIHKWLEEEIESLIDWMKKQSHSLTGATFKKPVSFAFPHFLFNEETVREIIPVYFKIARGHLDKDNLTSFNHSGFAPSICLDGYYSCNLFYLKKILRLVKKSGRNLILTCHSILPENFNSDSDQIEEQYKRWGNWKISPNTIQEIICEAKKIDLEFYTTSEIAGIATFSDPNLEHAARENLTLHDEQWISIRDLMNIKELDLSNKRISNLDGIQYFLGLEKLDLSDNQISDFKLLKKLPRLKQLNIANNALLSDEKAI